jgi:hypothetical protein
VDEREAEGEDQRRGGAGRERHERPLGVACLAQAPGGVADCEQHQRGDAERLQRDVVGEEADAEAEAATRQRPAQQADGHHEQRREIGIRAGNRHLRDRSRLDDHTADTEADEAREQLRAQTWHYPPGPWGRVRIWTKSRLRTSAYGLTWISWVSVPSLSIRVTFPIGKPCG